MSFNKIFAKLGSDMRKPDAITEIKWDNFKEKIWPLDAAELFYVGRATESKLAQYGIRTIGDLAKTSPDTLRHMLGINGLKLWMYANGTDTSRVMLSNERYCGDAILQKSVTIDCIEKKRKKNTGEAPMYYVQNNHPAIIDRVTFNKVQEELARRKTKTPGSAKSSITSTGKYSRYALTDVLICGNCGTRYRRVTWSRNGVKRIVWRCISRLDYGKKYCSDSPTIMEDKLQEAIVRAVNKFNEQDNATYKALMRATISEALGLNGDPEEVDMLERKVEALNNKMLALVNESVSSGDGIEAHESEFMTLSQETELLKQRIAAIQESTAKDNGEQSRLEQIQAIISERESKCMEYDDSIVRQMVECIKVYPGGKLEIIFGGGYLVEESV